MGAVSATSIQHNGETMAIKYIFREDEPRTFQGGDKANAQRIGEALAVITERNGGHLYPDAVVSAARDDKSPLHTHFEWNDRIAGHKYRLDQARSLIRCINVIDTRTESGVIRAFVSIKDKSGVSYRAMGDVLNSADLQAKVLAAAERDLLAFESRYKALEDVCDLLREARKRIAARKAEAEATLAAR